MAAIPHITETAVVEKPADEDEHRQVLSLMTSLQVSGVIGRVLGA